ncbi:MAG: cytochrome c biogenesis protein CcsA [Phycisphaerae bacterium]|nr:cytochrome c biogenesis protein CcsA [Phycisphaerae bacterium]
MTAQLGEFLLIVGGAGLLAAIAAAVLRTLATRARAARAGLIVGSAALLGALALFIAAHARADLQLAAVAARCDASLEIPWRIVAAWSGGEGYLLLWASLASCVASAVALGRRRVVCRGEPITLAALASIPLVLVGVMLSDADPFRTLATAPAEGHALHPQLRHWAMAVHPPLLCLGMSASAAPFALVAGALWARRGDRHWVARVRPWVILAWASLGAGIAVGAFWAYVQLGWGGYWAWDPIENAALVPWLLLTALLHALMGHERRGVGKVWTAALSAAALTLTLLGAAVARSGLVQSVHAFAAAEGAGVLAIAAALVAVAAATLIIARGDLLAPDSSPAPAATRDIAITIGSTLLVGMAAAALLGLITPVAVRIMGGVGLGVAPAFYRRTFVPAALLAGVLMALAPMLPAAPGRARWRGLGIATSAAAVGIALAFLSGVRHPAVLACAAVLAMMASLPILQGASEVLEFSRASGYGIAQAALRVLDRTRRRIGGQIAHLGFACVMLGVAGSSLLAARATAALAPGESLTLAGRTLRLIGVRESRRGDANEVRAEVTLDGNATLRPAQRFHDGYDAPTPSVALDSGLAADLYVVLAGWEPNGARATIEARVNPLVAWIWIGAGLMAVGGGVSLSPRLLPRGTPIVAASPRAPHVSPMPGAEAPIPDAPAIHARGLACRAGGVDVLRDASFDIAAGTMTAILGCNGVGKTTLLRVLATLARPSAGTLRLFGGEPEAARGSIGLLGHQHMLYRDLTALENLVLAARLHSLADPRSRAIEEIARFDMSHRADERVGRLSRGEAQRVALARTLLHRPRLVLLDEPLTGLDTEAVVVLCETLRDMMRRGSTVVLTLHDPAAARRIADRVLVIERGRLADAIEPASPRSAERVEASP